MLDANVVEECPSEVALDSHHLLVVAQRNSDTQELVFVVRGLAAYNRGACSAFVAAYGFVVGGVAG